MTDGILGGFLRHKEAGNLIRLGNNWDGGYVVSEQDIASSHFLIGLGISDNWSFEEDFIKKNNVHLHAYDASISGRIFLGKFLKSLHKVHKPQIAISCYKTWVRYRNFFRGNKHHFPKFVGAQNGKKQISMSEIFNQIKSDKIFLKVDIEGSEYRILDTILRNQHRLTGAVIEFHDCDLHMTWIEKFVKGFALPIVHIHANDYSAISNDGIPHTLEISFSANSNISEIERKYPQDIDQPNNPDGQNIRLVFLD